MKRTINRRALFDALALATLLLALSVVVLGAYVRLSDAGLGCPDWPGCYGKAIVPQSTDLYPDRPLDTAKAWKEMAHRYAAGTLGMLVLLLHLAAYREGQTTRRFTGSLLVLTLFQALLGMWTVTLMLQPVVVLAHLAGGMVIISLLFGLLIVRRTEPLPLALPLRLAARLALVLVAAQILLGGWTSANYAAVACPDFPTCQGVWWPEMDFPAALSPPSADDYEGGVLDSRARTAIHVTHRIGAVVTLVAVGLLALFLARAGGPARRWGRLLGIAVAAQFTIGVLTILFYQPLPLAAAHNAGAALLLLATVGCNLRFGRRERRLREERLKHRIIPAVPPQTAFEKWSRISSANSANRY